MCIHGIFLQGKPRSVLSRELVEGLGFRVQRFKRPGPSGDMVLVVVFCKIL